MPQSPPLSEADADPLPTPLEGGSSDATATNFSRESRNLDVYVKSPKYQVCNGIKF